MRRPLIAITSAVLILAPSTAAYAASGTPQRPGGDVVSSIPSENGGDNGWGNCGHNSSGGAAHSGSQGAGGGNGGHHQGDVCADPGGSTDGGTGGGVSAT